MSSHPTESKRLLSHVIAEWACSLKYERLYPAAIQAAKLFWFDPIGCALGDSQQDDAKSLLKHYRAMSGRRGDTDSSRGEGGGNAGATLVFVNLFQKDAGAALLLGRKLLPPVRPRSAVLHRAMSITNRYFTSLLSIRS